MLCGMGKKKKIFFKETFFKNLKKIRTGRCAFLPTTLPLLHAICPSQNVFLPLFNLSNFFLSGDIMGILLY